MVTVTWRRDCKNRDVFGAYAAIHIFYYTNIDPWQKKSNFCNYIVCIQEMFFIIKPRHATLYIATICKEYNSNTFLKLQHIQ